MNNLKLILLLVLCSISLAGMAQKTVVEGIVTDPVDGNPLPFAAVLIEGSKIGTTTDENGKFKLEFSPRRVVGDSAKIQVSFIGYKVQSKTVSKYANTQLNFVLETKEQTLKTIEVVEEKSIEREELESTQMSAIKMPVEKVMRLPSIGGEVDIVKVMQLLPGVSGGVEGTTGMYVRGGTDDQNLVLLDGAPVYEFNHLFGFFSIFNPDAIQDFNLIKGAYPAKYGGRLSSVLEIEKKSGENDKIHGAGGIGLLSSRLTLEGPIVKDKLKFSVAARRTYIDQVVRWAGQLTNLVEEEVPYYFYDLSGKLSYNINDKNSLFLSTYFGRDVLYVSDQTGRSSGRPDDADGTFGFAKQNLTSSLRWNHIYGPKLNSNVTLINTFFNYDINGRFESNSISAISKIADYGGKADFNYKWNSRNLLQFGGELTHHAFQPNLVSTQGDISAFLASQDGPRLSFQEVGLYAGNEIKLLDSRLALNGGLRFSGAILPDKFYAGVEPRFGSRYSLSENDAVKLSYTRMNQYMHRVASSTATLPTDMWYPVTNNVLPQSADQIAAGYQHLFYKPRITASVEVYHKWMNNLIEYREGTNLILNNDFEDDLLQGSGRAYGLEFLVRRDIGRINGWVGYTLSWATRQFDDLNKGEEFFAKYDRRHDLSVVLNFEINKRLDFSTVWVFMNGARFTPQTGQYLVANPSFTGVYVVPVFADRNSVSMSPTHRLDLNLVLKPKPKPNRKWYGEWHFGCYNTYNRATPFQINIVPNADGTGFKYQQEGLFGFLPSIAYNFKF